MGPAAEVCIVPRGSWCRAELFLSLTDGRIPPRPENLLLSIKTNSSAELGIFQRFQIASPPGWGRAASSDCCANHDRVHRYFDRGSQWQAPLICTFLFLFNIVIKSGGLVIQLSNMTDLTQNTSVASMYCQHLMC